MAEFVKSPFDLLQRARKEGGDLVAFRLLTQDIVLVTGPEANEAFFRAPDDQLCRREAYKLMTPIFGEGVVFDAQPVRLEQQIRMVMQMLRDKRMRTYPPIIKDETMKQVGGWGERGEAELLDLMKAVTIYASSRCLIGDEFRDGMSQEFHELYDHLERGISPIAYIYPNAPLPSFRRRDRAREKLVQRVEGIIERRKRTGEAPNDGLQMLLDAKYKSGERLVPHEITGILIAIMMAGHHTSAGTAAWTLLELIRRPDLMERAHREVDAVFEQEGDLTYDGLRRMTFLHDVLKEVLRLHPPLIFLFRKVLRDFEFDGIRVQKGAMMCASPAVSHRIESVFPDHERFDPDRYSRDDHRFAWVAFGGGKHKCTGNAFGLLQLKAIVATLLRHYDFALMQPSEEYQDDYTQATVMPKSPTRIRYARREIPTGSTIELKERRSVVLDVKKPVTIKIDAQLCQGHSVCVSEVPSVFRVNDEGEVELLPESTGLAIPVQNARLSVIKSDVYRKIERAYEHCPNSALELIQ